MDEIPRGLVITSAQQLRAHFAHEAVHDVGMALDTWRHGLAATKNGYVDGAGQEHTEGPDHSTRIKAADYLVKFHGAYPAEGTGDAVGKPVSVTIVLSGHANGNGHTRAPLQAHGVRLHLGGDSAGADR